MIKIKCFSSFCSSEHCKEVYERICHAHLIPFYHQDYIFTSENDYTHAIIINTCMPELSIPKENVLGLAFEPYPLLDITHDFIEYAKKYIGRYFIGDCHDLPSPFIEHFGYMWHSPNQQNITFKPYLMSIVLSHKNFAPGHQYRHQMVKYIIDHRLPIDIYGYGSTMYEYHRVKGPFEGSEPYEHYMFSICIENFQSNHYFSEKIMDPLLVNCHPIYLGCKTIDSYLENIIHLTHDLQKDMELIIKILQHPNFYYKKTYSNKDKINLIHQLPHLFPK
jgi:Glycosyltransferase family 10 (fucosyltransferase) C-term